MRRVESNNPDILERMVGPFTSAAGKPSEINPGRGPKQHRHAEKTHRGILVCGGPGLFRVLFTPEDTTEIPRKAGWRAPAMEPRSTVGMIKAFFWASMAILLPLLLAQLD